jgi:hypothetical protein
MSLQKANGLFRQVALSARETIRKIAADTISLVFIGLGWLLLVLGLFLMVADTGIVSSNSVSLAFNHVLFIVAQSPGIPLGSADLATSSASIGGFVVWMLGLDTMLVGFGLWVRHRYARWIGVTIFGLAVFFDFVQFLLHGLLGAPGSAIELIVNSLILYGLLDREIWINA